MSIYTSIPVIGPGSLIRILRLLPGPGPVRCELFAASLDHPPPFLALSYTWGDPALGKETIEVNGYHAVITRSLFEGLLALQQQEPTLLWIDQLCIDQEDDDDKAQQLPFMRRIYAGAAKTVAWLGQGTPSSDRAMDYLQEAGTLGIDMGIDDLATIQERVLQLDLVYPEPLAEGLGTSDPSTPLRQKLDRIIDHEHWGEWQDMEVVEDVIKLFKNAYFTRGWIKQEIAIPSVLTFRCGGKTLDINTFTAAFVVFQSHYHYSAMRFSAKDTALRETDKAFTELQRQEIGKRLHLQDDTHMIIDPTLRTRVLYQSGLKEELRLERLLRRFGQQIGITNGSDRIYAFGGLASDFERLGLHNAIDYSKSWEQVHTVAMRRIVHHGAIHMLEHVQFPKSSVQLPSWVPDFSRKRHPTLTELTITSTKPFSAGAGPADPGHTDTGQSDTFRRPNTENMITDWDTKTLHHSGWIVDCIKQVGRGWGGGAEPATPDASIPFSVGVIAPCADIENFCLESAGMKEQPKSESEAQRAATAVWRIPILDHEHVGSQQTSRRATEQSARGYENVKNLLTWSHSISRGVPLEQVVPLLPEHEQQLQQLAEDEREAATAEMRISRLSSGLDWEGKIYFNSLAGLENRRPFLTEQGRVGVGPEGMEPGDVLCVLAGAPVPFVLRTLACSPEVESEKAYNLVGEAYCDGLMDGEILDLGISRTDFILV